MPDPLPIVIPTMLPDRALRGLVRQIGETAGHPHAIVYTGAQASAAHNRNLGLAQVAGDVCVMVDDDIEFGVKFGFFTVGWLRVFAEALARPEVVMVSAQLLNLDGSYAYMTGLQDCGNKPKSSGETVVPSKRLLTACCAFKHHGLRFDEGFVGSGFEDIDFCNQLAQARPDGVFLVCHSARAVHRNEAKNQRGPFWEKNEAHYKGKWGNP